MTEKHYGGSSSFGAKNTKVKPIKQTNIEQKQKKDKPQEKNTKMEFEGYSEIIKAGQIASQARAYALSIAKKGVPLLELAEKIESKIIELGGKPAFPVNLSINEVAAHDTPSHDDKRVAFGLLKIDLGVHIQGWIADTAVSVDLENSELNKKLIKNSQDSLSNALKIVNAEISLGEIGKTIENTTKKENFLPIHNLSGHSIEHYDLHAGMMVPNYDTKQPHKMEEGLFAIEPFVTNGSGSVRDSRMSGIYAVQKAGSVRDSFAREVLTFIAEEYISLPFSSRWLVKKFGTRALIALKQIEQAGILHQYPMLVEQGNGIVAQSEHTILIKDGKVIVTTL
ncbi:MAG TPA: type II methionyl aminopeptidase [Candidatus Nanoarchaeia archaeon]|nr:type II methionyl aminopeptidase [Candidatus Nanoarchaeia archaeon]